jgi:hypothetical protein
LWVLVVAALVAVVSIVAATHRAVEIDEDSISYISGAQGIAAGHGYINFDGRALTTWPPGTSALLAAGDKLGLAETSTALAINILGAVATVLLTYLLVRRHTRPGWLPLIAALVVATSPALLRLEDVVASEPLFIPLVLAFLLVHEDAAATDAFGPSVVSALVAAAAVYARWHGMALVAAGALVLVVAASGSARRRLLRALTFCGVVVALLLPWVVRNIAQGGTPFGVRSTMSSLSATATDVARAIGRVFLPEQAPMAFIWLAAVAVGIVAIVGTITWRPSDRTRRGASPTSPITTVAVSTLALMVFAIGARAVGGTDLTLRTLGPAYVPSLVLGFAWFDRMRSRWTGAVRATAIAVAVVFVAWAAINVPRLALLVRDDARTVSGFSSSASTHSPLVDAVSSLPRDAVVFSNGPWSIWYRDHTREPRLVATAVGGLAQPIASNEDLLAAACGGSAYLAVFGRDHQPRDILSPGYSRLVKTTVVQEVGDGRLFALQPVDQSRCGRA